MALYFFDVKDDGQAGPPDGIGTEFIDRNSIPDEAVALLASIVGDRLSKGSHRIFSVSVRENDGPVIFKASLSLQAGWQ